MSDFNGHRLALLLVIGIFVTGFAALYLISLWSPTFAIIGALGAIVWMGWEG
jgi:hypothetical protein